MSVCAWNVLENYCFVYFAEGSVFHTELADCANGAHGHLRCGRLVKWNHFFPPHISHSLAYEFSMQMPKIWTFFTHFHSDSLSFFLFPLISSCFLFQTLSNVLLLLSLPFFHISSIFISFLLLLSNFLSLARSNDLSHSLSFSLFFSILLSLSLSESLSHICRNDRNICLYLSLCSFFFSFTC